MAKNRTVQLVYQTVYCTVGFIGFVASFDFFDMSFFGEVYIYFTNWSNYFCSIVMFVELINTIKTKEKRCAAPIPLLKFIGLLSILITFWGYNFPDPTRNPAWNYKINSIAFHIVLPIMYIIDWFFILRKKKNKIYISNLCFIFSHRLYYFYVYSCMDIKFQLK